MANNSENEESFWENPCGYEDMDNPRSYSTKFPENVATQARNALEKAKKYQDMFAYSFHTFDKFSELLPEWSNNEWIRSYDFANVHIPSDMIETFNLSEILENQTVAVLPKNKVYGSNVSEKYMDELMVNKIFDLVLPAMYKTLKAVTAGMLWIKSDDELFFNIHNSEHIKEHLNTSSKDVQAVLCQFYEVISSRKLENISLHKSEVLKNWDEKKKKTQALLVFRDTLNYLEHIGHVFDNYTRHSSKI